MSTATRNPRAAVKRPVAQAPSVKPVPKPHMRVTRHDRVTAFMFAAVLLLVFFVVMTMMRVRVEWETPIVLVPMEFSGNDGGYEDGVLGETLLVESPYPETDNPSPAEEMLDEVAMQELVDNVASVSSTGGTQAQVVGSEYAVGNDGYNSGTPGSAHGTGRPLGTGGGRYGGTRTEDRWIIRFADTASIDEYARQLDFFNIELGALLPPRLIFLSEMSRTPQLREVNTGSGEGRLYMQWQGGGTRREADVKLFERAGIDASRGTIFHFYSPETEQMLMRIEQEYAGRQPQEIRRTYFVVERGGNGYIFRVTRQVSISGR